MTTKVAYIHHFKHRVGVSVSERRVTKMSSLRQLKDFEKKAFTVAYVADEAKGLLFAALALCSPMDNFSRKVGRRIATARLTNLVQQPEHVKPGQFFFSIPLTEVSSATPEELTGIVLTQALDAANQW